MPSNIHAAAGQLKHAGVIAIVRGDFTVAHLVEAADALRSANVSAVEVTLNTPGVFDAIAQLRRAFDDTLLVGIGTVRTQAQAERAVAAGARFLVSPNFDAETVAICASTGYTALARRFYGDRSASCLCGGLPDGQIVPGGHARSRVP